MPALLAFPIMRILGLLLIFAYYANGDAIFMTVGQLLNGTVPNKEVVNYYYFQATQTEVVGNPQFQVELLRSSNVNPLSTKQMITLRFNAPPNATVFDAKGHTSIYFSPKVGTYYVGVHTFGDKYAFSVRYCYSVCTTICPSECLGNGACDLQSGVCTCDKTGDTQWEGATCNTSSTTIYMWGLSKTMFITILVLLSIFGAGAIAASTVIVIVIVKRWKLERTGYNKIIIEEERIKPIIQ